MVSPAIATIVIPTYNGEQRLPVPLKALAQQTTDLFEVIIVNNASTDDTECIAENHPAVLALRDRGIRCRTVYEERVGLTYARVRGVQEANGLIVCFLDDDNVPAPDYVAEAIKVFSDASIGVLVSRVFPHYEMAPTPAMERREHLLAINYKMGELPVEWAAGNTLAPTLGAGMWVRKAAFLMAVPWSIPELLLGDRQGQQLCSGGDIEIGLLIGRAGFKRVYCPQLKLQHVIPASRLTTSYFCRLITGIVRSTLTLEEKYFRKKNPVVQTAIAFLNLGIALLAAPVLLTRPDGFREFRFVLAARWARLRGSYPLLQEACPAPIEKKNTVSPLKNHVASR